MTMHLKYTLFWMSINQGWYVLSRAIPIVLLILAQGKSKCTNCSNLRHLAWTFLSMLQRGLHQNLTSMPHIDASQQCIWCDKFGHYYSTCQEFYEAIHQGDIYLSKINRILSKRSSRQLPFAIGSGGMKAYLDTLRRWNRLELNNELWQNRQRTTDVSQIPGKI